MNTFEMKRNKLLLMLVSFYLTISMTFIRFVMFVSVIKYVCIVRKNGAFARYKFENHTRQIKRELII